jgi:hypothetical protein
MTQERAMTRLIHVTLACVTPFACVGFAMWIAYLGWSWYLALAGGAAAGAIAMFVARARRDWSEACW